MRIKLFTIAHVPQELANAWLQHMRDFDTANPGCHFEVGSDCPDLTVQELLQIVRLNPELKVRVDKDVARVMEDELRAAGCRCSKPLLGYRPGVGPRCRTCNTVLSNWQCEGSGPVDQQP